MSDDCRTACTCIIPDGKRAGWCERHRRNKSAALIKLCQTRPEYFERWDAETKPDATGWIKPDTLPPIPLPTSGGAGTELKLLLAKFGITSQPNCQCGQRAREMDSNGVEWCELHIEEIVDWPEEEAHRRHLPFVRVAARVLIRRAIRNAKRKAK